MSVVESVLTVAEKWYAWRASRALLKEYKRAASEMPHLPRAELYARVLTRRGWSSPAEVERLLTRAEQSFCIWPAERTLRFRDVVHLVIYEEYLKANFILRGTHTNLGVVVARVIPPNI